MTSFAPAPVDSSKRRSQYLLDPRFQLKYTGLLIAVVLSVMLGLGLVIFRATSVAADQAQVAAGQAERALKESATSARILRMTASSYGEDAAGLGQTIDQELTQIDREYERNLKELAERSAQVEQQRLLVLYLLLGGGVGLLVLLAFLGVFITHRIVGPVHRMKRLCRQVGTARLTIGEGLRKGDELEDLFDTFVQMTFSLKALQSGRLATLDATIAKAEAQSVSPEVMDGLRSLRAQLCLGLGRESQLPPSLRGGGE